MSEVSPRAIDRLRHMIEAADAIGTYTQRGRQSFDAEPAIRDAILYQIIVLGEAAKAVMQADAAFAAKCSHVEWSLLAKMRDRLAHQYWATDRDIVWLTAIQDIPAMRTVLSGVLKDISRDCP